MRAAEEDEAFANFSQSSRRLARDVELRLASLTQLAGSGAGLLNWGETLDRDGWTSYVAGLQTIGHGSGFRGMGVAFRVVSAAEPAFVARARKDDSPDFRIWTRPGGQPLAGEAFPVTYLVPPSPANRQEVGFDLGSDPLFAPAIMLARDRGEPGLSSPRSANPESDSTRPDLFLFAPFYRGGRPDSINARREAFAGVVLIALSTERLLQPLVEQDGTRGIALRVADLEQDSAIFSSHPGVDHSGSRFLVSHKVTAGGRNWQLEFAVTPEWVASISHRNSLLVGLVGALGGLLLTGIVYHLAALRQSAEKLALDATAELRASEERFRRLAALSSDWYWEQGPDLRFREMAGGEPGNTIRPDIVGKHRWELPIELTEQEWAEHRAVLAARQPFFDLQYRVLSATGERPWVSISGEPIFDADGRFAGYRGVGKDITARKTIEEELRRHRDNLTDLVAERTADLLAAKNAAEQAYRVKSEFLANMSHELRTPLHAILAFARLGQDRTPARGDEKTHGYFSRIVDAGERLLSLVSNLLDLSKIEAGKMLVEPQPGDLVEMVRDVVAEFEALADERKLQWDLPAADARAPARVDAVRFSQVLRNVLSNAMKFSPDGGIIRILVEETTMTLGRRAEDMAAPVAAWRIAVIDEGIGIPEGELETVFDSFVQSSKTRTGAGGTGLGLTICREIVAAHRGSISARNRPEGGAVFEITVPR
ncbi:MAG: CHASE domain-containing protein [Sulfuritalea sp.]|nr:CHASE domain-containing protein [Sulfuritalea sp.]